MTKRVGLYGRVSDRQQADNTSIEGQWSRGRAYAQEHGFEVVAEKAEVITGASRWGARTVFNEYLDMADQGLLDGIVVDVPDRLGRGRALATLLDRAEKHGLEVFFADGSEVDSVSLGVAIITSGMERENIGRRSKAGKLKTIEKGGIIFSIAPYGYQIIREYDPQTGKKISATVEFEPEEIPHVTAIYHWLVNERESLRGIRARLYENEVLPRGTKKKMLKRYGKVLPWDKVPEDLSKLWSRASIKRVLSNPVYTGKWYYNRMETKRVEEGDKMKQVLVGERPRSEWVCVEVPAVISEDLFEEAQTILGKNKEQFTGRPPKYQYLLRGMLYCACGRKMSGAPYKSGGGDYRCNKSVSRIKEEKCPYPRLNQRLVESVVWNYIEGLLLNPETLVAGYEERQKEVEQENAILRERAEILQAEVHKTDVKLSTLLDMRLEGDIDKATYKRKKKEIKDATRDTKRELVEVQTQLAREPFTEDHKAQLLAFCEEIREGLETATFEDKRHLLLMLDTKVTHLPEEEAVRVEGAFPAKKLSLTS